MRDRVEGGVMNAISKIAAAARAVGLIAVAAATIGTAHAQNTPLKVGLLHSGTGAASTLGVNNRTALAMAVQETNAAGGILGRQVVLVIGDDQSDPTIAVGEAKRLVEQEKVEIMFGPSLSALALATAPVYAAAKIPSVVGAGAAEYTTALAPFGFSTLYPAEMQGVAMANYVAKERHAKSAAILADNAGNSKSVVQGAKATLAKLGITLTGVQEYTFHATDMTPQLLALRRDNPEVLLLHGVGAADLGYALKNLADIGWDVPVAGSASFGVFAPIILKVAGPDGFKNAWGLEVKGITYCSNDPVGQSEYAKFITRLKAFDPASFEKLTPAIAAYSYDAFTLMKAAAGGAKSTEGPKIAAWIEANAPWVKTIYGPFQASPTSHFLVSQDNLVPVDGLGKKREDGLVKRAGC
jgi:ABC-type branched-subunit amino acid transport system substrate-binding protein